MQSMILIRLERTIIALVLLVVTIGVFETSARAADICNAVALMDIPDKITGYGLKKGEIDDAVTQYRVDEKGEGQFCSHGGGCYPRYLIKDGVKVEALRLTNCNIGAAEPSIPGLNNDGTTIYDIDVDRSKNSAATLRADDVDNALLNLGMCSACAGNAAYIYIHNPSSKCGSLVAEALAGERSAINSLQNNPDFCQASYPESPASANGVASFAQPTVDEPPASNAHSISSALLIALVIGVVATLYFVPTVIAFLLRKQNAKAILALNLFLGWTFMGWVAALIWSLLADDSSEQR